MRAPLDRQYTGVCVHQGAHSENGYSNHTLNIRCVLLTFNVRLTAYTITQKWRKLKVGNFITFISIPDFHPIYRVHLDYVSFLSVRPSFVFAVLRLFDSHVVLLADFVVQ